MGKSKQKFIVISGFDIHDNNRGTQALGYGSLSFLEQRYGLIPDTKILSLRFIKNPLKQENRINKVDKVRGMDVIIATTAHTDEEARELLRMFNMPFKN